MTIIFPCVHCLVVHTLIPQVYEKLALTTKASQKGAVNPSHLRISAIATYMAGLAYLGLKTNAQSLHTRSVLARRSSLCHCRSVAAKK